MNRNRNASAFANPVIIGAITVLAALVGVFLAYSANQGLPFVPTRELKADVPDGSQLVKGNDVREGGFRIGFVSDLKPTQLPNGTVGAQVTMKLQQSHGKVPVDSYVNIRTRSVLGLKYVDLHKGTSTRMVPDGGTIYSPNAVPVQFDQIFQAFDAKTRDAIKQDLTGFGDTFASRGAALNDTIYSLPRLFQHLTPVAHYLSQPSNGLTNFFDSTDRFMNAVAPVAQQNAQVFGDMATTFEAISRDPNALQSTITQSPPTLDVSTDSLRAQRPFLADFTALGSALTPATAALRGALPQINPALEAGARTLIKTPPLNQRLQQVMGSLRSLARAPGTNLAINALSDTTQTLNPMLRYLGPYVTVCDYWNYFWTFLSEHLSERTSFGFAQRALLNSTNAAQPNNVGMEGATGPANGGSPVPENVSANEFLHGQPYGAAIDTQGNADCETGQRGYPHQLNYYDPQHRLFASDIHTPGDQGPTFAGQAHVPAGETFSRTPQTGPQLPPYPNNP